MYVNMHFNNGKDACQEFFNAIKSVKIISIVEKCEKQSHEFYSLNSLKIKPFLLKKRMLIDKFFKDALPIKTHL